MKKAIAFLALPCLFLTAISLHGQINTIYPHLTVSGFNDSWGGGFTEIRDDKRSVGLEVDYQFETRWESTMQTRLRYSVLTNRYALKDSSRLDELELFIRYPVFQKNNFLISIQGGGYLAGDLGGQEIQNQVHNSVSVKAINLPYQINTQFFPMLGASVWFEIPFESNSRIQLQSGYNIAPNYLQYFNASVGLAEIGMFEKSFISFSVGYSYTEAFLKESTRKAVAETENGLSFNLNLRAARFNFGMKIYPETNFSLGTIGISILNNEKSKSTQEPHLGALVEFGAIVNGGLFLRLATMPTFLGKEHDLLGFELRYQFWTYGNSELGNDPNQLGHYDQLGLGIYVNPFPIKSHFQILPYASLGVGYKAESLYQACSPSNKQLHSFGMSYVEGGLRIKFPSFGFDKNAFYGINANYAYTLVFGNNVGITSNNFEFGKSVGQIGIGGFVMIEF